MGKKVLKTIVTILSFSTAISITVFSASETKKEYENKFKLMIDYAVRTNEYVRQHLEDKSLVSYAHDMASKSAACAEQMTPPSTFSILHPHFLLVLENIERSFFFASKGSIERYRHHQKIVRKELQILETMAEKEGLQLYVWDRN